ncbi:PREDICTED: active regulator of SIRT1-like [Dinoponera quadriceps]|uniref:Active regulator of SIRT1 n=1 Tax=Dinoponera quadriceps TaxID=609295 RepID=A0A6P3WZ80_DINQU|nr:PREDICTED: active regulator of SIRT1-like [Dinoponera quadriceps]
MSKSLLRKSLKLFAEPNESGLHPGKKQKKKKRKDALYAGALELIPAKYRFTSKEDKAAINAILGRSNRVTVEEVKKHLASQKDPTEENVQQLLSLKTNQLSSEMSNKLLQRAVKKQMKRKEKSKDKLNKPKETAFTEEDFKKFEQEYIK